MVRKRRVRRDDDERKFVDSILLKIGGKLLLGAVVAILFLTLVQCTVKKPESPEWTTNFTIPVINRTYDMAELIRRLNQDGVSIDSQGNITYTFSKDLDTVRVSSNYLTTPDLSYSFGEKVDTIRIGTPIVPPVIIDIGTITGITGTLPNDTVTIAAQSFDVSSNLPQITTYTSADVFSGTAIAYLHNNLDVSLDTVMLDLWDIGTGTLLASDTFLTGIPSGASATIPIDLSGLTISNRFRIVAHCHTPGGFIDSVSTRGVSSELDFVGSVIVTSATAEIPALSRSFSDQVSLLESDRVDTATIASGTLSVTITNATNLTVNLSVTIPDIRQGGQPLSITPNVSGQQTTVLNVDLAGYDIIPNDVSVPQVLIIDAVAAIPATAPLHVTVSQNDSFFVDASLSGLSFSSVSGYFDSVDASFNGISDSIDIPTGFDSLQLVSAILTLEVENSIDLPGDLDILVIGDNGNILNLVGTIAPSGNLASATSTIIEPAAGSFLSPIPSQIDISGSVVFARGGYSGRIEVNDFIATTVTFTSPLEMIIRPSRVETDIERTTINQNDIDAITNHVIEARFIYNIINHLPLATQVDIYFSNDSATLFSNPQLLVNAISLPAAPVDLSGLVSDTISTGFQEVYLDSLDIKILENDTLFFSSALSLTGTNGQLVKFTVNDFIDISGRIEVAYRFDGSF